MLAWLDEEDEEYWDEVPVAMDMSRHSSASINSRNNSRHHATYQKVAIFDATNSTAQRRQWVLEQCTSPEKRGDKKTGVVFVESVCTDQELLQENYRFKVSNSPDYKDMTIEEGLVDLLKRVRNYEAQYETIDNGASPAAIYLFLLFFLFFFRAEHSHPLYLSSYHRCVRQTIFRTLKFSIYPPK